MTENNDRVQDKEGRPLKGLSLADCPEVFGDRVSGSVPFEPAILPKYQGQPVRLRFVMKDAHLYSLRFK